MKTSVDDDPQGPLDHERQLRLEADKTEDDIEEIVRKGDMLVAFLRQGTPSSEDLDTIKQYHDSINIICNLVLKYPNTFATLAYNFMQNTNSARSSLMQQIKFHKHWLLLPDHRLNLNTITIILRKLIKLGNLHLDVETFGVYINSKWEDLQRFPPLDN